MYTKINQIFTRERLMQTARLLGAFLIVVFIFGSAAPSVPGSASDGIWRDEFNGTLDGSWSWAGFEPSFVTIDESTFLEMPASQAADSRNMLLRPVAEGDFAITTRMLFEPNTNYQFAGLVIYQDMDNLLQFGRAYCGEEWCVGNGLYFDYAPYWEAGNFSTPVDIPNEAYLRLERRGEMVRALYSHDGHTSWREIGTHWISPDFQVNGVGLIASQDFNLIGISADFDYFELSEGGGFLPDGYHDYDQGVVPSWACNAGGWVVDPDDLLADVLIEIVVDDQTITSYPAGEFRQDLRDAGVCEDGTCSFHQPLWDEISSYEPHNVAVWAQDTPSGDWVLLRNSNKPLDCRTHDIYIFDPELGLTRQITDMRDTLEFNPEWSPDNKNVVFEVFGTDGAPMGIYTTNLATGATTPLAGAEGGNDPDWSPNGKWIAFDREPAEDATVYLLPPAGGVPQLLIEDAVSASWAPNSKRIAFARPSDGSIWTKNLETGAESFIAANGMSPAWSPDGAWIAYRGGDSIFKVRVNHVGVALGEPVQVTYLIPDTGQPSWSHNSKNIVFHSGQTQDYDLWVIPADRGEPTWLTGAPNFGDYDPAYSPKGMFIAYSSFSPDGQAARQWVSAYMADLEPGFWTPQEEPHTYRYEWVYSLPEPGSVVQDYDRSFMVSTEAPLYDGRVLLRGEQFRGIHTRDGVYCEGVPSIHPDQSTRLLNGYLTDTAMTYAEAVDLIATVSGRVVLDDSLTVDLSRHEIQSWSSLDWWGYVCTFTDAPLKMDLRVNYGHDWVESFYEAGHWVDVTVTESDGVTVKGTMSVFTEPKDYWGGEPGFQSLDGVWSPNQPDLQAGDWVFAVVDNGATASVQLGDITGEVDSESDTITGSILVSWLSEPVPVECLDWGSGGGPFNKDAGLVPPNGADIYSCSWDPETEWDIQPGQDIGVGYFTPDGHWVANAFRDERQKMDLRVNYGHDWVESFYEAGHQVSLTVTESDGETVKGTMTVFTEPKDYWGGEPGFQSLDGVWSPGQPDIQPYDWVYAMVDNGITAKVQIGEIHGVVDSTTDSITGTIDVPWIYDPVPVECFDWGSGGEPINKDAGFHLTDNSDTYFCGWDPVTEWDIQPWQDIGVSYFTPDGHWVANAFHDED